MRLSAAMKALVLQAARTWVLDPSLVRIGQQWAVVGHDVDERTRWTGMIVADIDWHHASRSGRSDEAPSRVWWCDITCCVRRRRDLIDVLTAAAT